jgi:hypothetical protein
MNSRGGKHEADGDACKVNATDSLVRGGGHAISRGYLSAEDIGGYSYEEQSADDMGKYVDCRWLVRLKLLDRGRRSCPLSGKVRWGGTDLSRYGGRASCRDTL